MIWIFPNLKMFRTWRVNHKCRNCGNEWYSKTKLYKGYEPDLHSMKGKHHCKDGKIGLIDAISAEKVQD